jgi:hypothetical protein
MNTMTSFRRSQSKHHLSHRKGSADHVAKKPKSSRAHSEPRIEQESSNALRDPDSAPENLLYDTTKKMKSGNFSVQVVKNGEGLIILAERVEGGENYVIELGDDQVPLIMNEFEGDYGKLTEFLEVMNKRLVLLNPRA